MDVNLVKIYQRYGFYETTNYIKHFDGYFAVTQVVPTMYDTPDSQFTRQVVTVYDSKERWSFNQTKTLF